MKNPVVSNQQVGSLQKKCDAQRKEIARLTAELASCQSEKANLLFDLVKERKLTELLKGQVRELETPNKVKGLHSLVTTPPAPVPDRHPATTIGE